MDARMMKMFSLAAMDLAKAMGEASVKKKKDKMEGENGGHPEPGSAFDCDPVEENMLDNTKQALAEPTSLNAQTDAEQTEHAAVEEPDSKGAVFGGPKESQYTFITLKKDKAPGMGVTPMAKNDSAGDKMSNTWSRLMAEDLKKHGGRAKKG